MTEIKYPAYQWLTLEQANVEHLSLTYAEFLLEQYQRSLADSKNILSFYVKMLRLVKIMSGRSAN